MKPIALLAVAAVLLSACASRSADRITLDLKSAWFEGRLVYYVTTDVSDRELAKQMNANYAPRLQDAVPDYPKPPELRTVLERVYAFPGAEQDKTVFASIPSPLGYESEDPSYSPLWLMVKVNWLVPEHVTELRSEGDIYRAEAQGWLELERTNVVLNCPVISIDGIEYLQAQ